jgi:hypothetical protein
MSSFRFLAAGVFALAAAQAFADERCADKPRIYPKFERRYINSFPKPHINCGACFGYYPTQWRSWAEACGQQEVEYSAAPQPDVKSAEPKPKAPEVAPQPKVPAPLPVPLPDPKPVDPKPVDPKKPDEPGKTSLLPVPATTVSISIPEPPVAKPAPPAPQTPIIPLIPTLPNVNVK